MHDSAVFQRTEIYQHPERFFSEGEFLLGDAAYSLSPWLVTPYKGQAGHAPGNLEFNKVVSQARVGVEHTTGVLKGRFGSL